MLTLLLGRAGTGKTMHVMNELKKRGEAGETPLLLIVPEQYSHNAERQLSAICGDGLSMYGETLSFTRLCGRVFSETGGAPAHILDSGGQILLMHRALESAASQLMVFGKRGPRTQSLETLFVAIEEFKNLGIYPETLEQMAAQTANPLRDKLCDLSLIFDAYNALLHTHGCDSTDRLILLADKMEESTIGETGHIYFDGFNDFTAQELRIIEKLIRKNAELTICLTCDLQSADTDVFEIPRKTVERLRRLAGTYNIECKMKIFDGKEKEREITDSHKADELIFLEKHFFEHSMAEYPGKCRTITVYAAPTRYSECEHAAYTIWKLIRSGYRWRDIGVMTRNWDEYGQVCENVFEKYNISFFSSGRTDILDKPPIAIIDAALEIASSRWGYKQIFRYIKSGLLGLETDECAEFENYALKWNIQGSAWVREWTLPPDGYGKVADKETMERINGLRRLIIEPLFKLRDGMKGVTEADVKLRVLHSFLGDIKLPEHLAKKADEFEKRGETRLAYEYAQLWDIIKNAMEQFFLILGNTKLSAVEFRKLITLTLSRYDVGVIPVALDTTALGSMAMSRRRDLKCLIILGATDESIPMLTRGKGALSDSEREELTRLGAEMPTGIEEQYNREMNMLYSTMTLPSHELIITHPTGLEERPSYIVKRLLTMFNIDAITLPEEEYMTAALTPYLELVMMRKNIGQYTGNRDKLSNSAAQKLYGRKLSLSATRVDRYYSCPFQYFMQNGLQLDPRTPAEFDASATGLFIHNVLEGVSGDIMASVGFKNADEELCRSLTARHIEQYIRGTLFNFEGKTTRSKYLFRRLEEDVFRITLDTLDELKTSDFEPLEMELDLENYLSPLKLRGSVDRVDGWEHGGKLYLRVMDYKTGKKSFNLSDVLYGRNMQMLIYLFALKEYGSIKYGMEIMPAGVLYVPARDVFLQLPRNTTEEKIIKKRESALRRSGLVLDDLSVLEAMENGEEKKYLPVRLTKNGITGDSLVTPNQVATLSEHVFHMLQRAASDISNGKIDCIPYYKSPEDNACLYCEYHAVCAFDESSGDRRRLAWQLKARQVWEELEARGKERGVMGL